MDRSIYDTRGRRKYLVPIELNAFLRAALKADEQTASFCAVLAFTGARASEVLSLTAECIDDGECAISFHTLKRRGLVIRALPVPRKLLHYLDGVHHYRTAQRDPATAKTRLWTFSRTTAWRRVRFVMERASNPAHLATARALRHALGAGGRRNKVGLEMIQRWLGHANIETTTIYSTVIGPDERALLRPIWRPLAQVLDRLVSSNRR